MAVGEATLLELLGFSSLALGYWIDHDANAPSEAKPFSGIISLAGGGLLVAGFFALLTSPTTVGGPASVQAVVPNVAAPISGRVSAISGQYDDVMSYAYASDRLL